MKIICGIESSRSGTQAAKAATALALRFKDTLHFIRQRKSSNTGKASLLPLPILAALHPGSGEGKRSLAKGATREQFVSGPLDEKLVQLSGGAAVRLLVVSAPKKSKSAAWKLGSLAERTAEAATVPTLIVRNASPFESWSRRGRKLKIFVAVDFTAPAEAALRWVGKLKKLGACEITVGYVDWPPAECARTGITGAQPLTGNAPEIQRFLERNLKDWATEILGDKATHIRVAPNWGRADSALLALAVRAKADLLVTGTHQHHGFLRLAGLSVSRGLLQHAPMNVACVPAPATSEGSPQVLPSFRNVLATTDFSRLGDQAIPHAYAALANGGTVHLLHVLPGTHATGALPPGLAPHPAGQKQLQEQIAVASSKLKALIPNAAQTLGIRTEIEVVEGADVATAICQAAERFQTDLICLGTHGRSGISSALLGSVAKGVMAKSTRPLLTIRAQPT